MSSPLAAPFLAPAACGAKQWLAQDRRVPCHLDSKVAICNASGKIGFLGLIGKPGLDEVDVEGVTRTRGVDDWNLFRLLVKQMIIGLQPCALATCFQGNDREVPGQNLNRRDQTLLARDHFSLFHIREEDVDTGTVLEQLGLISQRIAPTRIDRDLSVPLYWYAPRDL